MVAQNYKLNANSRLFRRRLATDLGVKQDLKRELPKLFLAFEKAYELFKKEIVLTPLSARARGFEASLMNSKMIQCIQENFPDNWSFGKFKRFVLRIGGYIILFKKFDRKNRPMNISTKNVRAIAQQMALPLFGRTFKTEEPILFFGYTKNSTGSLINPKIVYLDDDLVKWVLSSKDLGINFDKKKSKSSKPTSPINTLATPTLKEGKGVNKKAV